MLARIRWVERDEGFASSSCGRFDLLVSHRDGSWQALDWERGKAPRYDERWKAEAWCETQLREQGVSRGSP